MYQVDISQRADGLLGLILKRNQSDPDRSAEIRAAVHSAIIELRNGHPSIWLLDSDRYPDATVLYNPPIKVHFRKLAEGKIGIIDFEEMRP